MRIIIKAAYSWFLWGLKVISSSKDHMINTIEQVDTYISLSFHVVSTFGSIYSQGIQKSTQWNFSTITMSSPLLDVLFGR